MIILVWIRLPDVTGNAPIPSPSVASSPFSDTWVPGELYELPHLLVPPASPGLTGAVDGGGPPSLPPENFSNIPGAGASFQWAMQPVGLTDQDAAVKREHIAYYFNNVRGLQFLFTCKVALGAIQAVSANPYVTLFISDVTTNAGRYARPDGVGRIVRRFVCNCESAVCQSAAPGIIT